MNSKLSASDFYRLTSIFDGKEWSTKVGHDVVFEILADMLASFSDDQKALLFDLCDRYLWISMSEYTELLLRTLDQIESSELEKVRRVFLFPIIKLKDINKVKSSVVLLYNFRSAHFGGLKFRNIEFKLLDSLESLENQKFGEGDSLFLVDDFIGTGGTLNETLTFALTNNTLSLNHITVVSLVTQEETANYLRKEKINFYTYVEIKKGISDYYVEDELATRIEIMQNLEELIPSVSNYKFGFKKSEALVTMNRTPNNTFPIFWKSHRRAGKYIKAPFPRFYEK